MERASFVKLLWLLGMASSVALLLLYLIALSRLLQTGSGLIYLD